jgi:K+-transporting ATPase ATPase A chain
MAFNFAGILVLYGLQRLQSVLPFNPKHFGTVLPDLALNTAVSFATNTSWHSHAGETTLDYMVQMAGITVQSLPVGRHQHRRRGRADPGFCPHRYASSRPW